MEALLWICLGLVVGALVACVALGLWYGGDDRNHY